MVTAPTITKWSAPERLESEARGGQRRRDNRQRTMELGEPPLTPLLRGELLKLRLGLKLRLRLKYRLLTPERSDNSF